MPRRALIAASIMLLVPALALGHCDTLGGPVVTAARTAFEGGDLIPLLRWVPAEAEAELASAFEKTRQVRDLSPAARELADRWFFETVVRLHRAGEGEPFTGLAPPGAPVDPPAAAADEALKLGTPDPLLQLLAPALEAGVRQRFQAVLEARRHADESVARGRELVEAHVELVHYSERLRELVVSGVGARGGSTDAPRREGTGRTSGDDRVLLRERGDMLPFSRDQFLAVFELYNTSLWPAPALLYLVTLVVFWLVATLGLIPGSAAFNVAPGR